MFNLFIFRCGENLFHFAGLFVYYFSDHEGLPLDFILAQQSCLSLEKSRSCSMTHCIGNSLPMRIIENKSPLQTIFCRSMYYRFHLILRRFRTYAILVCVQRRHDFIKLHEVATFFFLVNSVEFCLRKHVIQFASTKKKSKTLGCHLGTSKGVEKSTRKK